VIETMVTPNTEVVLPVLPEFNHLTCPKCGDRCGYLFAGCRCLDCELDLQAHLTGAEDELTYSCCCGHEFPVLIAQDDNGAWLAVSDTHCPKCGADSPWYDLFDEDDDYQGAFYQAG
jgi:hypothetical protein